MQKNDIVKLFISDLTNEGLGVGRHEDLVYFVKNALPGDTVNAIITKVMNNVAYAKTTEIIEESKDRVKPICENSNQCGGCTLLNLNYEKQLEYKKKNVLNVLSRVGKLDVLKVYEGIIGSKNPIYFRNKVQVPFGVRDGKIIYGFYAGRTHHIIPCENCIVSFKGSDKILKTIKEGLEKYNISIYDEVTHKGCFREVLIRHGNTLGEISLTYIVTDEKDIMKLDEYVRSKVDITTSTININTDDNNVLLGKKNLPLFGKGYIEDSIGDIKYHISPESFYQVNMEMTKVLYDKVVEYAGFKGDENVLDLYCGIGTISLYIAKYVKSVHGVEIVKKAVENAIDNAKLNNIVNANFECLDAASINGGNYDVIIVDPPRKGLDKNTISFIINSGASKLIYVSCDPGTLARDINELHEKYNLERIVNVDMFPHTMHVETIALFKKI